MKSAGLDTFASRNPYADSDLRAFEVDIPTHRHRNDAVWTPYLSDETVMAPFAMVHPLCPDNAIAFNYAHPREGLSEV